MDRSIHDLANMINAWRYDQTADTCEWAGNVLQHVFQDGNPLHDNPLAELGRLNTFQLRTLIRMAASAAIAPDN